MNSAVFKKQNVAIGNSIAIEFKKRRVSEKSISLI